MKANKQTRVAQKTPRNFRAVVGADTYAVWVRMALLTMLLETR